MQHITTYWLQQLIAALVPATHELVVARHSQSVPHELLPGYADDIIVISLGIGREPTRIATLILEPNVEYRPWTLLLPSGENDLGICEAPLEYPSEVRTRGDAEVVAGLACGHAIPHIGRSTRDLDIAAWRWIAKREEENARMTQALLDSFRTENGAQYEW